MNYIMPEGTGIKNINDFYSKLKEMLKSSDDIVLDFGAIRSIHLSVAMVLMAAHREAKTLGMPIKLKNVSTEVRRQLYLSGFNL